MEVWVTACRWGDLQHAGAKIIAFMDSDDRGLSEDEHATRWRPWMRCLACHTKPQHHPAGLVDASRLSVVVYGRCDRPASYSAAAPKSGRLHQRRVQSVGGLHQVKMTWYERAESRWKRCVVRRRSHGVQANVVGLSHVPNFQDGSETFNSNALAIT